MTLAADGFSSGSAERRRWAISLTVVLLLHAAAGLYLASRRVPLDAGGPPPAAVMIDLAPLPAPTPPAPAPPEPILDPQPQPVVAPPLPPPPPLPEVPLPQFEPSPAPRPAVVLPKPPPKVKPPPKPVEHPPEVQPERPPPPAAPAVAAPPAPAAAPPAVNSAAAQASWQARLVGWLERYKRYPRLAQEQHQEGVVHVRFTMDRSGRVLSAQIERGSGFPLLDEEATALLQRAQPLPALPPEVPGAQLTLSLPLQFSLRDQRR